MKKSVAGIIFFIVSSNRIGRADVEYTTLFTPDEINSSSPAANTAKSFAAAARMGHYAWRGTTPPDEAPLIQDCAVKTGASPWPGSCNPAGMAAALYANGSGSWVQSIYTGTDTMSAVNAQVTHLVSLRSPNVVPIFGHADHWGINHRIWKDATTGAVTEFDFYDGGPAGTRDGTNTGYLNSEMFVDPATWQNIYFKVITTVPTSDVYYGKYVNLYEPPGGVEPTPSTSQYRRSPSPLGSGATVTPSRVRDLALKALFDAGLTRHQQKWAVFATSTPVLPFEVAGVYPDGSDWDYYMVPFLNRDHEIIALALLERATLRFQMATVLTNPLRFRGYSYAQAREIAQGSLRPGETLGRGLMTWDPAATSEHAYSPMAPYYEFELYRAGQLLGHRIVRIEDGRVSDLAAEQRSRRLRD